MGSAHEVRTILIMLRGRARHSPSSVPASCSSSAAAGCRDSGPSGGNGVVVVGTTTQVGDLLRQVGGRRVTVRQILRPNSDPHEYEPRPSDVKALADAQLVVRSGGDVDDWLGSLVDNSGTDAPVLTLIDHVHRLRRTAIWTRTGGRTPAMPCWPWRRSATAS